MSGHTRQAIGALLETLSFSRNEMPADTWCDVDTNGLANLVANERCDLWLYRSLKQKGLIAELDSNFTDWLGKRALRTAITNKLIDTARDRVVGILNAADIPFVLLKGAARRLLADDIPLVDARAMVDVDILVAPGRVQAAWDVLRRSGYGYKGDPAATPNDWVHRPPLADESGIGIELHHSTQRELTPEAAWERFSPGAREIQYDGLTAWVPDTTELFWHSLHHALFHQADGFRLRFLLDGVSLFAEPALDLNVVEERIANNETHDRPVVARTWTGCVKWLSEGAVGNPPHRYDIRRILGFSLAVFRRFPLSGRGSGRIIEEARRAELRLTPRPYVEGSGPALRARRFVAAVTVRGVYSIWRARHRV